MTMMTCHFKINNDNSYHIKDKRKLLCKIIGCDTPIHSSCKRCYQIKFAYHKTVKSIIKESIAEIKKLLNNE